MKSVQSTAFSGCLIWVILVFFISACIVPVAFMVGGFSSASNYAIQITGGWLCPAETTPERYSYGTTTIDDNGFEQPATAFELHCVDSSGSVVKNDPIVYAFIWIGISAGIGLILSIILALVFAVPGGMLVTKLLNRLRISSTTARPAER